MEKVSGNWSMSLFNNKKVLLLERKGHTARRVASVYSAVLSWPGEGYPSLGYFNPDLTTEGTHPGVTLQPGMGYPCPDFGRGYPPVGDWVPPLPVTPCRNFRNFGLK